MCNNSCVILYFFLLDPNNNECKWQLHRVQKQINIHRIQESSLKRLTKNDLTQSFPQSVKVGLFLCLLTVVSCVPVSVLPIN